MSAKRGEIRKHPALKTFVLFAAGIIAGDVASLRPFAGIVFLSFSLLVTLLLFRARRSHGILVAVLILSAGACAIALQRARCVLPDGILNRDVVALGIVEQWPTESGGRMRFDFTLSETIVDSSVVHHHALLSVRCKADSALLLLTPGMSVAIRGKIELAQRRRNPGEFDQRAFFGSRGVDGIIVANSRQGSVIPGKRTASGFLARVISPVRRFFSSVIHRYVGEAEGQFLEGLLLGERSGIPRETRENFSRAGVAHILAVSGTHVAIIAGFLLFACEVLRFPRIPRATIVAAGLVFFMLMTGAQAPVVRATIMGLILLLGTLLGERTGVYNTLGAAGLIILGLHPHQLYDPGFQLSFGAVLSIVYGYPKLTRSMNRIEGTSLWTKTLRGILRIGAVSVSALLGTLPTTIFTFERVSVVGVAANILVVPAAGLAIVLGLMTTGAALFSDALAAMEGGLTTLVLRMILFCVDTIGRLPVASIDASSLTGADGVTLCAGLLLLSQLDSPRRARVLTLVFLVAANCSVCSRPTGERLRFTAIDVGQGDALVVRFPDGKVMVIDAGPGSATFDAGRQIVGPFLRRQGITSIDMLVATHPHADHIGGMHWLLEDFEVHRVLDCGLATRSAVYASYTTLSRQCSVMTANSGMIIREFSGARVYILHPDSLWVRSGVNANNHSIVMKIVYGKTSLLLEGDAEVEAEERMGSLYGEFLRSAVLKVGHHGSATSTSTHFLDAVHPTTAVISVGRYNSFHHPSPDILLRLRERGVEVHRTDEEGAVIIESDGESWAMVDWR